MPKTIAAFRLIVRQSPNTLLRRVFAFLALAGLSISASAAPRVVPMDSRLWATTASPATFDRQEGFPNGMMTLRDGYAILKDHELGDGTIEFDMKALEFSDTGILFRRRDAESAEFFYLRTDPDCPAANDCYQYAPITHGQMQWDIYPEYQGPAAISEKGWNHIKLVVAGSHLEVYLNRAPTPTLVVARLRGLTKRGGIAFKGPAVFRQPDDRHDLAEDLVRSGPIGDGEAPGHRHAVAGIEADTYAVFRDAVGFRRRQFALAPGEGRAERARQPQQDRRSHARPRDRLAEDQCRRRGRPPVHNRSTSALRVRRGSLSTGSSPIRVAIPIILRRSASRSMDAWNPPMRPCAWRSYGARTRYW